MKNPKPPPWAAPGQEKRAIRMARIDAMPPDIRACVHEHGLTIVDAFLVLGIKKAKHINHLVQTVRKESFQGALDGATSKAAPHD